MLIDRILPLRQADAEGAGGAGDSAGAGDRGAAAAAAGGTDAKTQSVVQALRDLLPEDLRAEKAFEKFADVPALAKSFLELDRFRGRAIVPPGKEATPEERAKFFERLGRPKDPKGYKIDLGEGFQVTDQALLDQYFAAFHEAGLTADQANHLARFEAGRVKAAAETRSKRNGEDWQALDTEWGPKKAGNIEIARRAAAALGLKKADIDALGETAGSQAAVVRALHKVGLGLGEDRALGGTARDAGGDTPEAMQKRIDTLQASKEYRANDPAVHAEVREYYQKLYPNQAA